MGKPASNHPCPSSAPWRGWARAETFGGRPLVRGGSDAGKGSGRGSQGAATVEFALVLPLFLVLFFGVLDFGLTMYAKGVITHASQEGARFGTIYRLNPLSATDIQAHVQSYLQDSGFTDPVTITVTGAGGPSGTPLTVRVAYVYHYLALPDFLAGLAGDLNLSAETVVRME